MWTKNVSTRPLIQPCPLSRIRVADIGREDTGRGQVQENVCYVIVANTICATALRKKRDLLGLVTAVDRKGIG